MGCETIVLYAHTLNCFAFKRKYWINEGLERNPFHSPETRPWIKDRFLKHVQLLIHCEDGPVKFTVKFNEQSFSWKMIGKTTNGQNSCRFDRGQLQSSTLLFPPPFLSFQFIYTASKSITCLLPSFILLFSTNQVRKRYSAFFWWVRRCGEE